ncbi:hypothetical protein BD311DRAFT_681325 [Dichomitus squalens]|uniref:Uncharacterized protein n=1 Tax=Dichomitus squalens TaxID=114155 RepID=A0A4Q9N4T5_9APHY|nr:hypothetical protein BD311DRAFT_681325 [Dichomitus squalens]
MSNSLGSAVANLLSSLTAIGASLINSIIAVFQAICALFQDVAVSILQLAQALVAFAAGLFEGVLGFVAANFLAILVVGGIYYWYTRSRTTKGRSGSGKSIVSG